MIHELNVNEFYLIVPRTVVSQFTWKELFKESKRKMSGPGSSSIPAHTKRFVHLENWISDYYCVSSSDSRFTVYASLNLYFWFKQRYFLLGHVWVWEPDGWLPLDCVARWMPWHGWARGQVRLGQHVSITQTHRWSSER